MRLYSRRSEYVRRRELAALGIFAVGLVIVVGIFTTGWLLDAAAVAGLAISLIVPYVLHRRRRNAVAAS